MRQNRSHQLKLSFLKCSRILVAKNYSKLGLSEACQPAIKYAFDGIPVYPRVALDWSLDGKNLSGIARDLYLINGDVPKRRCIMRDDVFIYHAHTIFLLSLVCVGTNGPMSTSIEHELTKRALESIHVDEESSSRTTPFQVGGDDAA